ncbi:hypothetical protein SO694_00008461 [Aureococcus anophagefferens]|uniref:Right handed beta helix domain-containing protein n=1 Tax=Aureococcus anophagefferens TaxID=44056 RepID=A0ABR1GEF4_AURAN
MRLPLGALLVVLPVAAASVVSVSSADELRAAFADASATEVRLAADIFLGADESFTSRDAREDLRADGGADVRADAARFCADAAAAQRLRRRLAAAVGRAVDARADEPHARRLRRRPRGRASLSADNAAFVRCATDDGDGGAVAVYGANATLANCSFVACRAAGEGGAIFAERARLEVTGSTFADGAAADGGAIYARESSTTVTDSTFASSSSSASGGSLGVEGGSLALARAAFSGCVAGRDGGGLYASTGTSLTITNASFADCQAGADGADAEGGAIYALSESLAVDGSTFERNVARKGMALTHECSGGRLAMAHTTFAHNVYSDGRSVVRLASLAEASLDVIDAYGNDNKGDGTFVFSQLTNLNVRNSTFHDNFDRVFRAFQFYTGTFLIADCVFANNLDEKESDDSGGVAMFVKESPTSQIRIVRTTFENNTAYDDRHSYGGALFLKSDAVVEDCVFRGNSATEGGAIYVDIAAAEFKIYRSVFENNVADIGGAIASCASSGDYTWNGLMVVADVAATRNAALRADADKEGGGFLKVNGGRLALKNVSLAGNSAAGAPSGLGLRYAVAELHRVRSLSPNQTLFLANSVTVDFYCLDELVPVEAPDQYNEIAVTYAADECSLCREGRAWDGDSCEPCPPGTAKATGDAACGACPAGTVQPYLGFTACAECTENRVPDADAVDCEPCATYGANTCASPGDAVCACCEGFYDAGGTCRSCPKGASCPFGSELASLVVKEKWFRTTASSKKLYRCPGGGDACPGGNATGEGLCADGYDGVLCSDCERGHYATAGGVAFTCDGCDSGARGLSLGVYAFLFLLGFCGGIWLIFAERGRECFIFVADTQGGAANDVVGAVKDLGAEDGGMYANLGRHIGKFKAICAFYQIVSSVPVVYGATLNVPDVYGHFLRVASVTTFGFSELLATRCLSSASNERYYATTLVGTTVTPFVLLAFLAASYAVAKVKEKRPEQLQRTGMLLIEGFLLFLHLSLPLLSIGSVSALVCDAYDFGDGGDESFLRVAPAISCDGSLYRRFVRVYGILCVVLYPIGVPLVYFVLLYGARNELNPTESAEALAVLEHFSDHEIDFNVHKEVKVAEGLGDTPHQNHQHGTAVRNAISHNARASLIRRDTFQRGPAPRCRDDFREIWGGNTTRNRHRHAWYLWRDYEPRVYWWECLEVLRRVFFTALIAILDQGSKLQLAIAVAVAILYLAAYIQYRPFVFEEDDAIAEIASWAIVITLFVCLMIRAEIALHRPGLAVLSNLLLFAAALLPLFAFATVVAGALGEKPPEEEEKEEAEKPDSPPGSPWGDDKAPPGGLSPSELAARASGATAAVARAEQEAEVYDRVYEDDAPASPVTCGAACLPDFGPRGGVTFSEPASLPRDFGQTESL